jgi:hypothetical protein
LDFIQNSIKLIGESIKMILLPNRRLLYFL